MCSCGPRSAARGTLASSSLAQSAIHNNIKYKCVVVGHVVQHAAR